MRTIAQCVVTPGRDVAGCVSHMKQPMASLDRFTVITTMIANFARPPMTDAGFDIDESGVDDNACSRCDGEGWILGDCFEDTCCCEDPETEHDMIPCNLCNPGGDNP